MLCVFLAHRVRDGNCSSPFQSSPLFLGANCKGCSKLHSSPCTKRTGRTDALMRTPQSAWKSLSPQNRFLTSASVSPPWANSSLGRKECHWDCGLRGKGSTWPSDCPVAAVFVMEKRPWLDQHSSGKKGLPQPKSGDQKAFFALQHKRAPAEAETAEFRESGRGPWLTWMQW